MKTRQLKNNKKFVCCQNFEGFTLVEVMIALAILAVTLMAISFSLSSSMRQSEIAENSAVMSRLLKKKFVEIRLALEEDMKLGTFPEEKEEQGDFEEPYEAYQWEYSFKKIELPAMSGGKNTTGLPSGMQARFVQMVTDKISQSTRQLDLTVFLKEDPSEQIKVSTHLVKLK